MSKVPPLTLEDLGVATPETNREHIKRLSMQIESIIDGMAELRIVLKRVATEETK